MQKLLMSLPNVTELANSKIKIKSSTLPVVPFHFERLPGRDSCVTRRLEGYLKDGL